MSGLRGGLLVHALSLLIVLGSGCAARQTKQAQFFITPEHTEVRLKERCSFQDNHPGRDCRYLVRVDAVEVNHE